MECKKSLGGEQYANCGKYFSEQKCKGIILDVVAYNESARRFYERNGFFERTVEVMKILD